MRFLTLFPEAENVHLTKDVGMLPYSLHRECGYASTLACYENGTYPGMAQEMAGLELHFIRRIFHNRLLDGLWFVWCHRKRFDVLQTYHLRFSSLFWLFAFRLFAPKRKTYLKLDASEQIVHYNFGGIGGKINKMLLRSVDIISVETTELQQRLTMQWGLPVALVPNGCSLAPAPVRYQDKKQLILATGRIGLPKKRHELLLEAFADFAPAFPTWTLQLTGAVEAPFEAYISAYFQQHPQLRDRVRFTGMIQDRKILFAQYAAAKIFCLCSEQEGFPLALLEAAAAGCYIVSTPIPAAADITGRGQYGRILPAGNRQELCAAFSGLARNEAVMDRNVAPVQVFAQEKFSWKAIAKALDRLLQSSGQQA